MEIIKPGNLDKPKNIIKFKCDSCGCIFKADNTEYKSDNQYNETYYSCDCPSCGKVVVK